MLIAWFRRWMLRRRAARCKQGLTPVNLEHLFAAIKVNGAVTKYTPTFGMQQHITSHHLTVVDFYHRLEGAIDIVREETYVTRPQKNSKPLRLRLDDYLTTPQGHSVDIAEAVDTLVDRYTALHTSIAQKDTERKSYYARHFEHFSSELHELAECLMRLQ